MSGRFVFSVVLLVALAAPSNAKKSAQHFERNWSRKASQPPFGAAVVSARSQCGEDELFWQKKTACGPKVKKWKRMTAQDREDRAMSRLSTADQWGENEWPWKQKMFHRPKTIRGKRMTKQEYLEMLRLGAREYLPHNEWKRLKEEFTSEHAAEVNQMAFWFWEDFNAPYMPNWRSKEGAERWSDLTTDGRAEYWKKNSARRWSEGIVEESLVNVATSHGDMNRYQTRLTLRWYWRESESD